MTHQTLYDIVIVGGGLVGASLAMALQTTPLKIALIEAAPWFTTARPPSYDDRVLALSPSSQRIFTGMNLWQAIATETTPIKRIHVSDQGYFGFTRLASEDANLTALGFVVSARHLGQVLQTHLKTGERLQIFAPAQLSKLQCQATVIHVELTSNNEPQTLQTRLLVAADGGQSSIRQQLGIPVKETDYEQTAIIANVTSEHPHENVAYERFTTTGPLALLPMSNNACSLVWTKNPAEAQTIMRWDEKTFLAALQQQFGWRLGRFLKVGKRHSYPLHLIRLQQPIHNRIVFIGNAAHTLHPIAGQGFNLGLRDVATLAEVLARSRQAGQDVGQETTLQRYHNWQHTDQERVMRLTDSLVRIFSTALPPLVVARNLGLILMDALPPFKKQWIRQLAGLNGHPSRLMRGLPL
jgi:2-octaprenyl-6-methoxyphenol hydroxylase